MGKYMRKAKSSNGNVIDTITPLGVRTRAKTLALGGSNPNCDNRLVNESIGNPNLCSSSIGYLQLRNRRLLRLKPPVSRKSPNVGNPNLCDSIGSDGSSPNSSVRVRVTVGVDSAKSGGSVSAQLGRNCSNGDEFDVNCFGENLMESDTRERSTRESTPSNMIRDPDAIHTPGSTTRPTCSAEGPEAAHRLRISTQRSIPTSREMEEFFNDAEEQQQKEFIQKYNFDPANDKPLPGRYEWEKLRP